jgi:hypothetical protein
VVPFVNTVSGGSYGYNIGAVTRPRWSTLLLVTKATGRPLARLGGVSAQKRESRIVYDEMLDPVVHNRWSEYRMHENAKGFWCENEIRVSCDSPFTGCM